MALDTPTGLNAHALGSLLRQYTSTPLNRGAAAALTVAFEIRKAGHDMRGEKISDESIKKEIQQIYNQMLGITDPDVGVAQARQATQQRRP